MQPRIAARSRHDTIELSQTGDYWTAHFAGRVLLLRNCKGLGDLAQLLAKPGQGLHVRELMQPSAASATGPARAWGAEGLCVVRAGAWEQPLDARAHAAFRARFVALTEDLEEAEMRHDLGRLQQLRAEREHLVDQLRQRRHVADADTERARKAVYNRLRAAIRHIGKHDVALARHLEITIRTGVVCCYRPEAARYARLT